MVKKDKIREMLRQDGNQRVLDEIAKFSVYTEAKLRRAYVIGAVASKIYPGKRDKVSKTSSSIDTLSNPNNRVLGVDGEYIVVTETTLRYASK
jgi:hypothetical protein